MFFIRICLIVLYFIRPIVSLTEEKCENTNCECIQNDIELEYHCPSADWHRRLVIQKMGDRKMTWQCVNVDDMDKYLPNLKLSAREVKFINCPLTTEAALNIDFKNIVAMEIINSTIKAGFMDVLNVSPSVNDLKRLFLKSSLFDDNVDFYNFNAPKLKYMELVNIDFIHGHKLFELQLKLNRLLLRSNHIKELKARTFENLFELYSLDLSLNNISNIESDAFKNLFELAHLFLENNNISLLNIEVFRDLKRLATIDLSFNKICFLHREVLKPLKSLREIKLNYNEGLELDDNIFSDFTQLRSIEIQSSNLKTIPENAFRGSEYIENINFENNSISHIPTSLFEGLSYLLYLNLKHNVIQTIDSGAFSSLSRLKSLELGSNRIERMNSELLKPLVNLKRIDLSYNIIYHLQDDIFSNQRNLREIHLSHNKYKYSVRPTSVPENNPFFKCNHLEILDLGHNLIEDIPYELFESIRSLRSFVLTGNQIKSVNLKQLWDIAYRGVMLRLNENKITKFENETSLPKEAEKPGEEEHASYVLIGQNPLHCDCKTYTFLKYINDVMRRSAEWGIVFAWNNLVCASPDYLQGVEFSLLSSFIQGCD